MPHCVIECPVELNTVVDFDHLVKAIHDTADAPSLFSRVVCHILSVRYPRAQKGTRRRSYVNAV